MLRHVDYTKIPGVTYSGPFANITLKGLKSWLGKGMIIHIPDPRGKHAPAPGRHGRRKAFCHRILAQDGAWT